MGPCIHRHSLSSSKDHLIFLPCVLSEERGFGTAVGNPTSDVSLEVELLGKYGRGEGGATPDTQSLT
jgi:hypothetical protein